MRSYTRFCLIHVKVEGYLFDTDITVALELQHSYADALYDVGGRICKYVKSLRNIEYIGI